MNKKIIVLLISVFWIISLLAFIGYKQYTVSTGERVLLSMRPVDPRDIFRGDYVVINYNISNVGTTEHFSKGDIVYVTLTKQGKYHQATDVSRTKPSKLAIKGRVKYGISSSVRIEYGIESYFVPEGQGRVLENLRRTGEMDVEVAVDRFGNSVITAVYVNGEKFLS